MEGSVSVILGDLCFLAAVLCSKSMSGIARVLKNLFLLFLFFCLIELLLD